MVNIDLPNFATTTITIWLYDILLPPLSTLIPHLYRLHRAGSCFTALSYPASEG